jgi:hypothetical protein
MVVRQALLCELTETAQALNQSYSFSGQTNCETASASDIINTIGETSVGPSITMINQSRCD